MSGTTIRTQTTSDVAAIEAATAAAFHDAAHAQVYSEIRALERRLVVSLPFHNRP